MSVKNSDAETQRLVKRRMQTVKKRTNVQPLTLDDLKSAEKSVVRFIQMEEFSDEIETLQKGNAHVNRPSHIHIYIYIYSFSRRFYPKRLPRESFT